MKLIHTSDLQIGKVFRYVDEATQSVLQDARVEAVTRLALLAREQGARAILVAGDLYDMEGLSTRTLDQPVERMRAQADLEWHLIPGNHDPARPNGLWDRVMRKGLPANVRAHLEPVPAAILDGEAWLLPAPLIRTWAVSDPTEWMDAAETPAGAVRIGLAHGSIAQFGSDDATTHNYIDPRRVEAARLDYLALGDWHGQKRISDRLWYSGTLETDGFDVENGGGALLVDIAAPGAVPTVTRLETGRFLWRALPWMLSAADDIRVLEERLRGLDPDLDRVLVDLTVSGTLSLAERRTFEETVVESVGAALRWLRLDDTRLVLRPSDEDLDAIDHGGFVRAAADTLKALSDDPANPERGIAALALQRLYVEHLKLGSAAP